MGEEDITHVEVLYKMKWSKEGSEHEKAVSCMHPIKDGVVDGLVKLGQKMAKDVDANAG